MGNVWRPNTINMIKLCLVTKHVDVVQSGQTVANMFEQTNVLQYLLSFKFYLTRFNTTSQGFPAEFKCLVTEQCF